MVDMNRDDELAEIDTTEDEFDAMWAEAQDDRFWTVVITKSAAATTTPSHVRGTTTTMTTVAPGAGDLARA